MLCVLYYAWVDVSQTIAYYLEYNNPTIIIISVLLLYDEQWKVLPNSCIPHEPMKDFNHESSAIKWKK